MNKKQQIIFLYYENGLIQTEIAKELNVSKAYITKIIKSDDRYVKEKEKRKNENKMKNKEQTKKYIKMKREYNKILKECIRKQHLQATMELSNKHSISNRNFRNWNSSIYDYNSKKKEYILKKDVHVTKDVPRKVSWKIANFS